MKEDAIQEEIAQSNLESFNSFINFFLLFFALAWYLLQAIGFYKLAKTNGAKKPWIAWIPIFQNYILGELIGDKVWGIGQAKWILPLGQVIEIILVAFAPNTIIFAWIKVIFTLVYFVYYLCALNRFYSTFDPDKSFLFLFLDIMFPVTIPIWTFILRKVDLSVPRQYHHSSE